MQPVWKKPKSRAARRKEERSIDHRSASKKTGSDTQGRSSAPTLFLVDPVRVRHMTHIPIHRFPRKTRVSIHGLLYFYLCTFPRDITRRPVASSSGKKVWMRARARLRTRKDDRRSASVPCISNYFPPLSSRRLIEMAA